MVDFFISLAVTVVLTIAVKLYFQDNGLAAFPVLTFLVIAVISYMATGFIHSLF